MEDFPPRYAAAVGLPKDLKILQNQRWLCLRQTFIELDDGKIYRKTLQI